MPAAITITDEVPFTRNEQAHTFTLVLPLDVITVRELIETRVRAEVEAYNQKRPLLFRGLVRPASTGQSDEAPLLHRFQPLDWRDQADQAVRSFLGNGFLILVNDQQVTELEDRIALTPETHVTFFKLVPLVGG